MPNCEQCGAVFAPQREHARFCGTGCRAAWNRDQAERRVIDQTLAGLRAGANAASTDKRLAAR